MGGAEGTAAAVAAVAPAAAAAAAAAGGRAAATRGLVKLPESNLLIEDKGVAGSHVVSVQLLDVTKIKTPLLSIAFYLYPPLFYVVFFWILYSNLSNICYVLYEFS
jgi:hypothetical protein